MGFFEPPSWVPQLESKQHHVLLINEPGTNFPSGPPDSITIGEFLLTESYGRVPFKDSKDPFTCGLSGRTFSNDQQNDRVEALARALSHELGWQVNVGTEWDKVMGVFSLNTVR